MRRPARKTSPIMVLAERYVFIRYSLVTLCRTAGTNFSPGHRNGCGNRPGLAMTRVISQSLLLAVRVRDSAVGMSLSRREIEVLEHGARGETSKEIASALGIVERTVDWHSAQASGRLGA